MLVKAPAAMGKHLNSKIKKLCGPLWPTLSLLHVNN